jgi:tetratricopeptide (TPR) repeat protein
MLLTLAAFPAILLRPIDSAPSAGAPVAAVLTRQVATELRERARIGVTVLQDGLTPPPAPPRSGEGSRSPTDVSGPSERRVARSVGASHILAGSLTAYPSAEEGGAGKAVLVLRLSEIAGDATREATVEVAVSARAKADKVAASLARESAVVFRQKFLADVVAAASRKGEVTVASLLREAKDAVEVGDVETAQHSLGEASRRAPRDPGVNAALGDLNAASGRLAVAISRYRQALLFDPANASVRLRLLRALDAHGSMEDLATEARQAVQAGVSDAEAWRALGRASLSLGLVSEAENAYERALAAGPAAAGAIRGQALLWVATGQAGRAIRLLEARGGGEPELKELLGLARVFPADAEADATARLAAPAAAAEAPAFAAWHAALTTEARLLLAMGRRASAAGMGRLEARRERLTLSARAHGLLRLASTAVAPAEVAGTHDQLLEGLRALARAALAGAVAEEWSWPGSRAVVARLWDAAERSLGRETPAGE